MFRRARVVARGRADALRGGIAKAKLLIPMLVRTTGFRPIAGGHFQNRRKRLFVSASLAVLAGLMRLPTALFRFMDAFKSFAKRLSGNNCNKFQHPL